MEPNTNNFELFKPISACKLDFITLLQLIVVIKLKNNIESIRSTDIKLKINKFSNIYKSEILCFK